LLGIDPDTLETVAHNVEMARKIPYLDYIKGLLPQHCHFESVSKQEVLAEQLKRITLISEKSLAALTPLSLKRILNRS
jgi:hypothetical protein